MLLDTERDILTLLHCVRHVSHPSEQPDNCDPKSESRTPLCLGPPVARTLPDRSPVCARLPKPFTPQNVDKNGDILKVANI